MKRSQQRKLLKKSKRQQKLKRQKAKTSRGKSGNRFETRAREAFEFINPTKAVKHNELLEAVYGRLRQFDVTVRTGGSLEWAIEAKDYGRRVSLEKVEALETKLAELAVPPSKGGAMVSRSGYQAGPIERARFLRNDPNARARVLDLYQLRSVTPQDWGNRIRQLELQFACQTLVPSDVKVKLKGEGQTAGETPRTYDRRSSFIYRTDGRVDGNLLDLINERISGLQALIGSQQTEPVSLQPEVGQCLRIDGKLFEISDISFNVAPNTIQSHISLDIGSQARDTLVDCISGQNWIIPDPEKALTASRDGLNISLRFDQEVHSDLTSLRMPAGTERDDSANLANSIQLRVALNLLRAMGDSPSPPSEVVKLVEDGTRAFLAEDYVAAKDLYWLSCSKASSLVALVNLTFIYEQEGDLDRARHLAARTAELFPLEENGFVNYIHVAIRRKDLSDARSVLEAAKLLHAGAPRLKRIEAELLYQEGRYMDACARFMELCHRGIDSGENRLNAALCESRSGLVKEAAWDASVAWATGKIPPSRAWLVLDFLIAADQPEEAGRIGIEVLGRADTDLDEASADRLRITVAGACCDSKGTEDAERTLGDVRDPSRDRRYNYVLGLVRFHQGRYAEAMRALQEFVLLVPDSSAGHWNLAISAVQCGAPGKARDSLEKCSEADARERAQYWQVRARAYAMLDEAVETLRCVARQIECGADEAHAWILASNAALSGGHGQLFWELRLRCIDVGSDDPDIALEQALVLVDRRLVDLSIEPARIAALMERAEASARRDRLFFVKLLHMLRSRAPSVKQIWAEGKSVTLPSSFACLLAAEALFAGEPDIVLELVGRLVPNGFAEAPRMGLPHPSAIKAGALFSLGRLEEAQLAIADPTIDYEHPLHKVMAAYSEYANGHLDEALLLLDKAQKMAGRTLEFESFDSSALSKQVDIAMRSR